MGLVIRSWGAGHLVKNDLLVRSGPYAYVRHPFYLGTLCIGVGFAAMLGGYSAAAALAVLLPWFFGFYFPRKERLEAQRLAGLYGEAFERYRAAVPALWPMRGPYVPSPAPSPPRSGERADNETARATESQEPLPAESERWSWARYDGNNELGTLLACLAGLAVVGVWAVARG
jgi:hypothetical protein